MTELGDDDRPGIMTEPGDDAIVWVGGGGGQSRDAMTDLGDSDRVGE